ncbi:MAG: ATP-grasp domain-containing protein [Bacteroidales bacterium]|nr:ATP-grasp domain-containing protein [Bacteroidales bacterium]
MDMEYNLLCCNVGRRGRLMLDFRKSLSGKGKVVGTDNWSVAPALFLADKMYVVPKIRERNYLETVLDICEREGIKAVATFIDPEVELLAAHRQVFLDRGILPLCPSEHTAHLCFDKYEMFRHLSSRGVRTVLTYRDLNGFKKGLTKGEIAFPVFIKPVTGSGSVGARRVNDMTTLEEIFKEGRYDYIIQELMTGGDCDADVYVDCISHEVVSVFAKRKIETRIGGASKTVSFKDPALFDFVKEVCAVLELSGPCDMDFFCKDGQWYLSEINPRFGGAYLHAYGAGVDFMKYILRNIDGLSNEPEIGRYDEGVLMLMYDDVVITRESELLRDYHE